MTGPRSHAAKEHSQGLPVPRLLRDLPTHTQAITLPSRLPPAFPRRPCKSGCGREDFLASHLGFLFPRRKPLGVCTCLQNVFILAGAALWQRKGCNGPRRPAPGASVGPLACLPGSPPISSAAQSRWGRAAVPLRLPQPMRSCLVLSGFVTVGDQGQSKMYDSETQ